jgi:Protein of unknown function (DUF2510)
MTRSSGPPAGWYEDTRARGLVRWWDGKRWTERTRELVRPQTAPRPGTDSPAGAAQAGTGNSGPLAARPGFPREGRHARSAEERSQPFGWAGNPPDEHVAGPARDGLHRQGRKESPASGSGGSSLEAHVEAELQALKRGMQLGADQPAGIPAQPITQPPPPGQPQPGPQRLVPQRPSPRHRFNPPPGWPPPPSGWVPPAASWDPGTSLPAAPAGWQWWLPPYEHHDPFPAHMAGARAASSPHLRPSSRKKAPRRRKVAMFAVIAGVAVLLVVVAQGLRSGGGQAGPGGSGQPARKLAACYGTDGYGNPQLMVTADTLQQCARFVEQLAEVVHPGLLPGGSAALGGTQCTMVAARNSQEPFSVTVGQYGPSNLCSLLAGEGYGQL